MTLRQIETKHVKFSIADGILYGTYPPDSEVTLETAREIVETRLAFTSGISYPCLIDMRGMKSVTKEARQYLANEGAAGIIVSAIITGNVFTRTLAHIFITINKPMIPIQLFGDEESAKSWLLKFVNMADKRQL